MKLKTIYVCQECEHQVTKWMGKCPNCDAWNSFTEDVINVGKPAKALGSAPRQKAEKPQAIHSKAKNERRSTDIGELDQVLGGGIVTGSLILLSGEPGIGKSTLTLQILDGIASKVSKCLYITGEESVEQVSDRANRLGCAHENIQLQYDTSLESILATIESEKPDFLVLDSIQVIASNEVASSAGSLAQVRTVTEAIMNAIKSRGIPTLLIGHVNKDGKIAGPKVLEHLVDTVLVLEGERDRELRVLRAVKNRYGTVSEVGLFEMEEKGLQELKNPGERVLSGRPKQVMGSCLTLTMEGNRPLLIEVQALTSTTAFGYPKRMASGFDRNRLELLIAVLERHAGLNLSDKDVYVNVVGGLHLREPAADLAICSAIASSLKKKELPGETVAWGEVSLTGEIRPAFRDQARQKAAEKLGLKMLEVGRVRELNSK